MKYTLLLLLLFALASAVFAQEQSSETDSVYSEILKETRPIQLVYPRGYDPKAKGSYELLYCLDGIPNVLKMETAFLQSEGFIPQQIILVGIPAISANGVSMRERDLSPTVKGPNTGGASNFLQFLKQELMPHLAQRLPIKSSGHTLYGASMGGLFTVYAFVNEPQLFTSFLAIDPSLWWDGFCLKNEMEKSFKRTKSLSNTLWIAGREGPAFKAMGITGADSLLRQCAPEGLRWKCIAYPDETHYSTMLKGFWDGMKFSYGGFYAAAKAYSFSQRIMIKPTSGIVLKNKAFPMNCYNIGAGNYIRFTTDGTEPTLNSPTLTGQETPIVLSKDSKVMFKSFGIREDYNKSATAAFKIGKAIPSIEKPVGAKQGFGFAYFKGDWDTLPDLAKLKADSSGIANSDFNPNNFKSPNGFICLVEGFLEIKNDGYYVFTKVDGNDYSKVYLNRQLILGTVNGSIAGNEESCILPLQKGFYAFKIQYQRKKNGKQLQPFYIKPEGEEDFPITVKMLYYQ